MAEGPYDHVDPRTDAEVAADEAKAAAKGKARRARNKAVTEPEPVSVK